MEKLESEVDKFIMQKDFDGIHFAEFRRALLTIEVRLAEFEGNLEASVSDCFYETQKLKEQLEDLRPQSKKLEEVLEATKEIKLPFKFESTLNTFTVRLLDLNFVEVLTESLHEQPIQSDYKRKHQGQGLSPTKLATFDRVTREEGDTARKSSVQSITERFNSSAMVRKTVLPRLTITTSDSHSDPYDLRKSVAIPSTRKVTLDSGRRLEDHNFQSNDVNLNACENVYDLGRRTSGYKSFRVSQPLVKTEPELVISDFAEEPTQTPRSKKMPTAGSSANLLKMAGASLTRKSVVGEAKKFPKYYSSVITLNDDTGIVCNQVIDEFRFRTILASLKAVPRHVRMIEMINNVFKINPVPMLKGAFESKLNYILQIEVPRNQMMANLVYTKRDLEILANFNIVLVN